MFLISPAFLAVVTQALENYKNLDNIQNSTQLPDETLFIFILI